MGWTFGFLEITETSLTKHFVKCIVMLIGGHNNEHLTHSIKIHDGIC